MNPREFARDGDYPTAIVLTYSFDPLFFERISLPDLWAGGTGDTLVVADAGEASRAIRGREGRCLHLGRSYQLALATSAGAFHPKVMLRLGREGGLVWAGSGNLTCGGWGANRELAAAWRIGPKQADTGSWVGGFLEAVTRCLPPNRHFDVLGRAREIDWVVTAADSVTESPLIATFEGESLAVKLARRWAGRRFDEVRILTGSTDENAAFIRWAHDAFGISKATILVPGASSTLLAREVERSPVELRVLGVPSPALHAKFYWFAGPDGSAAIVGSANCSAQAWLRPPGAGGNVEAVVVYDSPDRDAFAPVLSCFDDTLFEPARLATERREAEGEPTAADECAQVPEVSWEAATGEVRVTFADPVRADSCQLILEGTPGGIQLLASQTDGRNWYGESGEVVDAGRTLFGVIEVCRDGAVERTGVWVNILSELRHASRGHRIAAALAALSRVQTPREDQKLVALLGQIVTSLLTEPESFPDPVGRHGRVPAINDNGRTGEAIDPAAFIRSIDEVDSGEKDRSYGRRSSTLSLTAIMRVLFGAAAAPDAYVGIATGDADRDGEDDETGSLPAPDGPGAAEPVHAAPPDYRIRRRFAAQIDGCVARIGSEAFADSCTATQLVNAAAFPLAVVFAARPGWVDSSAARRWVTGVCDALFLVGGEGRTILDRVRARYARDGREHAFLSSVGDGTLWLGLLRALDAICWEGDNAGLQRALTLRAVWRFGTLLATTSHGRFRRLAAEFEDNVPRPVLLEASEACERLEALETHLRDNWDALLREQGNLSPDFDETDLVWRPPGSWGECIGSAAWGGNLHVRFHHHTSANKFCSKYYLNVTKARAWSGEIARRFAALAGT